MTTEKKEPTSIAIGSLQKTLKEMDEQHARNRAEKLKKMDEQHLRDRAEILRLIENLKKLRLRKLKTKDPSKRAGKNGHVVVAAGPMTRFSSLPDAIQAFLMNFDDPVPFDTLMEGLKAGGVDFGTKKGREISNVKSSITNNTKEPNPRFRWKNKGTKNEAVELVVAAAAN